MKTTKLFMAAAALLGMMSFTSCTPYERGLMTGAVVGGVVGNATATNNRYSNNRYSNNVNYRLGYRHGCQSSTSRYMRNRYKFNNYPEYRDGWYAGRRSCR